MSVLGRCGVRAGRATAHAQQKADEERREGRAKGIFEDLLNLEINVIITPGMTARKMPDPRNALANILEAYGTLLREFSIETQRKWKEQGSPRIEVFGEGISDRGYVKPEPSMVGENGRLRPIKVAELARTGGEPGLAAFSDLRVWSVEAGAVACALIATPGWPGAGELNEKVVLFKRIERNCEQIEEILAGVPHRDAGKRNVQQDIELAPEQILTVRKIWEVGIATVVMQTVVQLDGDIVTRIHDRHRDASSAPMHDLHRQSVESAVKNWHFLGETVAQFLTSVLKRFL